MPNSRTHNPLHATLLFTARLGRLPWPLTPAFIAAATLALGLASERAGAAVWLAFWSLADWALLAQLPRRGLSFGPVQPSHLALLLLRSALAWLGLEAAGAPLPVGLGLATVLPPAPAAWVGWALQPLLWSMAAYALAVEPFRLQLAELTVADERAASGTRTVSILHISDLHVERLTRREREVLALAQRLEPDLILLTGDYLSLSYVGEERAIGEVREFLAGLRARHGVYAVRGTPQVDPPWLLPRLFAGLGIEVLEGERREVEVGGHRLRIVGVGCDRDLARDGAALRAAMAGAPDGCYTILLYHMPDLLEVAAEVGVDLYLAGHTHGGQLRLPLYGAIITASLHGKRFEAGWYRRGRTRLYISRGIGLEGMGAPRARFLCRPEVVHVRLGG